MLCVTHQFLGQHDVLSTWQEGSAMANPWHSVAADQYSFCG